MESIRYRDTRVDNETVERLRQQTKETPEHGVALFNGYRKYANMQLWRSQLLHEFLGTSVESYGNYLMCTCGLEALKTDIEFNAIPSSILPKEVADLNLSDLIRVRYHVDFSDGPKPVVAVIVATSYDHGLGRRYFSAYCQSCLEFVMDTEHTNAEKFVKIHNSSHRN